MNYLKHERTFESARRINGSTFAICTPMPSASDDDDGGTNDNASDGGEEKGNDIEKLLQNRSCVSATSSRQIMIVDLEQIRLV